VLRLRWFCSQGRFCCMPVRASRVASNFVFASLRGRQQEQFMFSTHEKEEVWWRDVGDKAAPNLGPNACSTVYLAQVSRAPAEKLRRQRSENFEEVVRKVRRRSTR
jgi:hypothetical protein